MNQGLWQGQKRPQIGMVDRDIRMLGVKSWEDVGGWFSRHDAEFVGRFWSACPQGAIVVELGAWLGRSTCYLGAVSQERGLTHFAVDDWRAGDITSTGDTEISVGARMQTRFGYDVALRTLGLESVVRTLTSSTQDAARLFGEESVHCVWIDACHYGPSVLADIVFWWRPLKTGSVMCGHDYFRRDGSPNDVTRIVNTLASLNNMETMTGGNCWALRKCGDSVRLPGTDGILDSERTINLNRGTWTPS